MGLTRETIAAAADMLRADPALQAEIIAITDQDHALERTRLAAIQRGIRWEEAEPEALSDEQLAQVSGGISPEEQNDIEQQRLRRLEDCRRSMAFLSFLCY